MNNAFGNQAVRNKLISDYNGDTSLDHFHDGRFAVIQPAGKGHKGGLDAMLLAASVPSNASGTLADLGSGAGTASLAVASLNPFLSVTMVEKNDHMARLASDTIGLQENAKLSQRLSILNADVTLSGEKRVAAGLGENTFDHVMMNPPYNHSGQRNSPDPMKMEAHVMGIGGLDPWVRTAAAICKPGGNLVMIYRTEQLGEVIACCRGRFGGLRIKPVHSKSGHEAKRILVRAVRASNAPMTIVPGLVVHEDNGSFTPLAEGIFRGRQQIEF